MERSLSINTPRVLALLENVMVLLVMITWSTSRVFIFVDVEQGIISVFCVVKFHTFNTLSKLT